MDIITNSEFLKKIKEAPFGAYLFYGEEDYLKTHALTALCDAMEIDEGLQIFNLVKLEVLDYSPERLIDVLSMPPMMAEQKLVVLSGLNIKKMAAPNSGELSELIDALAHLEEFDYNTFVLVVPSGNITEDTEKKGVRIMSGALKTLSEHLQPVKFESPSEGKLALWAARHFEHHGVKAGAEVCSYLVNYSAKDMFTLANEIEKLSFYARAQGRDTVCRDDVTLVCSEEMEYGAFEFSNAVLEGRKNDALSILSVMKFKQVEPLLIMGELSGICTDLLRIKILLLAGKNPQQIERETGMNSYKARLYINSAQKMELEKLKRTVAMAADADIAMKFRFDSGYMQLEKLICSI